LNRKNKYGKLRLRKLTKSISKDEAKYAVVANLPIDNELKYETGFTLFKHKIPMWIFLIVLVGLTIWSFRKTFL
jgi:hypothetical protein